MPIHIKLMLTIPCNEKKAILSTLVFFEGIIRHYEGNYNKAKKLFIHALDSCYKFSLFYSKHVVHMDYKRDKKVKKNTS